MTRSNPNVLRKFEKLKKLKRNRIPNNTTFSRYKSELGQFTINRLKRIDNSRKKDSTFILECVRKLFANDKQLESVTECGRNSMMQRKTRMSPGKRKIVDEIFIERLSIDKIDETDVKERYLRLNSLISNAIGNISRVSNAFDCILVHALLLLRSAFEMIDFNFCDFRPKIRITSCRRKWIASSSR